MASAEDKRLGVYFVHENDLKYDKTFNSPDYNFSEEYDSLLVAESNSIITDEQKKTLAQMREMLKQNRKFAEKVIKYLLDDAFKFNAQDLFDSHLNSLESVIRHFVFSIGKSALKYFRRMYVIS